MGEPAGRVVGGDGGAGGPGGGAQVWGFQFDYLGATFLVNGNTRTGTTLVDGRYASLTPWTALENVTNLLGLSLVPW